MKVIEENSQLSDEDIALHVQNGDKESFGILVERYESKFTRYGKKFISQKEDVQDVVQDVFIKAYQNIKGFDVSQKFSSWIYRIAHNTFVNALRKNERNKTINFDFEFDTLIPHPIYEDPGESQRELEEIRVRLEKCLAEIAPKYREVLVLHYFEEMSYKDMSDILQVPAGTVGIRLKRARVALSRVWDKIDIK